MVLNPFNLAVKVVSVKIMNFSVTQVGFVNLVEAKEMLAAQDNYVTEIWFVDKIISAKVAGLLKVLAAQEKNVVKTWFAVWKIIAPCAALRVKRAAPETKINAFSLLVITTTYAW